MAQKRIDLNEGAQRNFVTNTKRASAFIGGLGSGKTFAGLARGLKFSQQPVAAGQYYGPRGLAGAITYPVLKDVVIPQFLEMMEGSGLWKYGDADNSYIKSENKALLKANCLCRDKLKCKHVAEILFRSLDNPDKVRGVELSWFFIDEGRHLTEYSWKLLSGRLRQRSYAHAGWVCSTPNGFDWMWKLFHDDSPDRLEGGVWFGAPTVDNSKHLPPEYIKGLQADYEGRFYEQEVEGKFVGIVQGAVFPHWDSRKMLVPLEYDPDLPLYSFWDFGVGDLAVVLFAQLDHLAKTFKDGTKVYVPVMKFIDGLEGRDLTSADWAERWKDWLRENTNGARTVRDIGDPAGMQRNMVTGTSVIADLNSQGVPIGPAPKKAPDYAIRILDNMMAGERVLVSDRVPRLSAAFATHKWPMDDSGNRVGNKPVHDWTSHWCDAARYGATALLTHFARSEAPKPIQDPPPGTMGHILEQLTRKPEQWLGPQPTPNIEWQPTAVGSR